MPHLQSLVPLEGLKVEDEFKSEEVQAVEEDEMVRYSNNFSCHILRIPCFSCDKL